MRALVCLFAAALLWAAASTSALYAAEPGWLGATVKTVTPSTRLPKGLSLVSGVVVTEITPDGPAAKAGFRAGDVISSVDGKATTNAEAFLKLIEDLGAGSSVKVTRVRPREGQAIVAVVLATKPAPTAAPATEREHAKKKASKLPRAAGNSESDQEKTIREEQDKAEKRAQDAQGAEQAERAKRDKDIRDSEGFGGASPSAPPPAKPESGPAPVGQAPNLESNIPRKADKAPPSPDTPYTTIKVFYATDRKEAAGKTPGPAYSGDRSTITYGTCDVTVPKDHRVGELESPSFVRLEFSQNPAKHVILANIQKQTAIDFYRDVGSKVAASKGKSAFIFVHGYNVTFEDAARRTAQMSYDLKFDGAPVFFSWPSQGTYFGYAVDESNIEYARTDLKNFIVDFARNSSVEQIYLVAHSMGNRALTTAVADVYRDAPDVKAKIKEVILAAPDIDAEVFKRDIAPALIGDGQAVTLYASSKDWALKASKKFHGYARAGDTGPSITVAPGIVTVDSSEVDTGFLGHAYFAESNSIIADIFDILSGLFKPEERARLVPVSGAQGAYWKIPKAAK